MSKNKMINCKSCGQEIASIATICPHCGKKVKKPVYKKVWFWVLIAIVGIIALSNSNSPANDPAKDTVINSTTPIINEPAETEETTLSKKTVYTVGDVLQDGDMKIVYTSSGEYKETNDFSQPKDGYKYIFLGFSFENTATNSDQSISFYSFECYADGYAADMYYAGEEELSATLSAGRVTTGYIYFEIPEDAQDIQVEYTTNVFTSDKITFIYEGEKDSGYVPEVNATATPGAYKVGDIVTSSNLNITYLSCEEYISDNMFIQPKDGYRFVICEFEFENVGSSDEFVSSYDFDCYADGFNCASSFVGENDLSATLSAGRKTIGTVTFEVPINAEIIEVEYLSNYWTSNRVVFTVQ